MIYRNVGMAAVGLLAAAVTPDPLSAQPGAGDWAFLTRYREVLLPRLDDTHPYFFPFQRILIWARK